MVCAEHGRRRGWRPAPRRTLASWHRLMRALRPRSLRSALTGRPQAPRLALVCFGCDEFYKPGSGEAVPAAAREIRDAARRSGASNSACSFRRTSCSRSSTRIPYFDAYTRNLSADEAREPLGASVYPGRRRRRHVRRSRDAATRAGVRRAVRRRSPSVACRRCRASTRRECKPGAYEFPREFNKLRAIADRFRSRDRPAERAAGEPGAARLLLHRRAGGVRDGRRAGVSSAGDREAQAAGVRTATGVFGAGGKSLAAGCRTPGAAAGTRKVPRWDFLPRVMREVVFGDKAAVRLTSAGARVGLLAQASASPPSIVHRCSAHDGVRGVVWRQQAIAMRRARRDARNRVARAESRSIFRRLDALQKLDALRMQVDTLSAYEHSRRAAPASVGPLLRHATLSRRSQRVLRGVQQADVRRHARQRCSRRCTRCQKRRGANDDYGDTYSLLKAYIITTSHPGKEHDRASSRPR